MCSSDIPAADPRIAEAALANSQIARDALDWYTNYQKTTLQPLQQRNADLNERVVNQALDISQRNSNISNDTYEYQKATFRPAEQALVADATAYDSEANREKLASQAQGDVNQQFDIMAAERMRDQQRMGINPSSARTAAVMGQTDAARGLALTSAANKARSGADAIGWARKLDAAGLGRNLASQQSTAAQIALSGGSTASNASNAIGAGARGDAAVMGNGFNAATSGNSAAGNLLMGASGQNQQSGIVNANNQSQVTGTVVGAAAASAPTWVPALAAFLSDKNVKKNRKPVKTSAAMQAIENMPVDEWEYDPKKTGAADGKKHIGPMAQDFAREVGGDGQVINLSDSLGVTMAAVKDLNIRLKKMESPARMAARG